MSKQSSPKPVVFEQSCVKRGSACSRGFASGMALIMQRLPYVNDCSEAGRHDGGSNLKDEAATGILR